MPIDGNFIFFVGIYAKVDSAISKLTETLIGGSMHWVGAMAYVLVTLWVMFTGYRAISGTLREPLMAVAVNMAKVVLIVTTACSMSFFGTDINQFLNNDLGKGINQLVTGSDSSISASIDKNLGMTTFVMSTIGAVQTGNGTSVDPLTAAKLDKALNAGIFGAAAPPLTAAAMLLMYRFAMAMVTGLAPIFILCLLFNPTKPLFQRWLLYAIGTLFSMAMLNVVTSIVLDISIDVAAALWATDLLGDFIPNSMRQGLLQISLEQGGIGLIFTMLIITVPRMVGNFFQGTLGDFMHYSGFGNGVDQWKAGNGMPDTPKSTQNNSHSDRKR